MILGLVGPALILFHSNFQLGSVNSNVALFAMLIVAASGVVGRYLYAKIHLGLYGRKAAVREILADVDALKRLLGDGVPASRRIVGELNAFAKLAMTPRSRRPGQFLVDVVLHMRTGSRAPPPAFGRGARTHQARGEAAQAGRGGCGASGLRPPSSS